MYGIFLDAKTINHLEMDMSGVRSVLTDLQVNSLTNLEDVKRAIKGKEVVISNKVMLDETILKSSKYLQLVCIAATGMNNIDLQAAIDNNIVVCNVENYANESVVQHVFGLIISLMRNFPAYKTALTNKEWHKNKSFSLLSYNIENLTDKTLGIIGYGVLGKAIEKMAHCFGMNVIIAERKDIAIEMVRSGRILFDSVLEQADVITLHCPLTDETKNLISFTQLQKMKSNCILINTARGGIVDEQALLTALKSGEIAAAGIDVLEQEPPTNQSILLQDDIKNFTNLIVTPHIAWASRQSRQHLLDKIAGNIRYFITGEYQELTNFYF
ncbi:MAG: NAD(P)-dependent oxidoreductase [Thiohalomonadales bacterium]